MKASLIKGVLAILLFHAGQTGWKRPNDHCMWPGPPVKRALRSTVSGENRNVVLGAGFDPAPAAPETSTLLLSQPLTCVTW